MDLGIAGRRAIVCASSQGLGLACGTALAGEGVEVWLNGRDPGRLDAAVDELTRTVAAPVHGVVGDITTDAGRRALLDACPEPDILVTNNAGPQPGGIDDLTEDDFARALELHFWTPIVLLRAVLGGMKERRFGRIVNITSAVVTRPSVTMVASSGARGGMTAVMKAVSIQAAPFNVTINNVLPERIDSGRQIQMAQVAVERDGVTFEEARRLQAASIAAKRLGLPSELGAACAFLCSAQASFISGNNLHLDGGSYPGLV